MFQFGANTANTGSATLGATNNAQAPAKEAFVFSAGAAPSFNFSSVPAQVIFSLNLIL